MFECQSEVRFDSPPMRENDGECGHARNITVDPPVVVRPRAVRVRRKHAIQDRRTALRIHRRQMKGQALRGFPRRVSLVTSADPGSATTYLE